jgi:ABC-type nitrate/sulfonate/bicarbonate transport system permease component
VLITYSGFVRNVAGPWFEFLRPIPPIAWIPVAILWFGLGSFSASFVVFVGAFFPMNLAVCRGIASVTPLHLQAARCLGAGRRLLLTDIVFPAALPQLMTGIRISTGIAWSSVIAAEMIGVRDGLGYSLQLSRTVLDVESVFVNVAAIGLIGWLTSTGLARLERHCPPHGTEGAAA